MRLCCPAKINLHLRVGRRRPDGFHPLLTWMTTVGLFDTLTINVVPPGDSGQTGAVLRLDCDWPGLPCDASNLVVRAADAIAAAVRAEGRGAGGRDTADGAVTRVAASEGTRQGVGAADGSAGRQRARADGEVTRVRPVVATLAKRIQLGAGLGGGSSDAARTLAGLNVLWDARLPASRLAKLAAALGSDVPFFLHGPSSVCTGRGEHVNPVARPVARWAVLVLPDIHMPTADVYRQFDAMDFGFDEAIEAPPDWREWAKLASAQLLPRLENDLERPAFEIRPDLGMLRDRIELAVGRPVRMSGSGSSLFTLFDEKDDADSTAVQITKDFGARSLAVELAPTLKDDAIDDAPST